MLKKTELRSTTGGHLDVGGTYDKRMLRFGTTVKQGITILLHSQVLDKSPSSPSTGMDEPLND